MPGVSDWSEADLNAALAEVKFKFLKPATRVFTAQALPSVVTREWLIENGFKRLTHAARQHGLDPRVVHGRLNSLNLHREPFTVTLPSRETWISEDTHDAVFNVDLINFTRVTEVEALASVQPGSFHKWLRARKWARRPHYVVRYRVGWVADRIAWQYLGRISDYPLVERKPRGWQSVKQVASALNLSETHVYRLLRATPSARVVKRRGIMALFIHPSDAAELTAVMPTAVKPGWISLADLCTELNRSMAGAHAALHRLNIKTEWFREPGKRRALMLSEFEASKLREWSATARRGRGGGAG